MGREYSRRFQVIFEDCRNINGIDTYIYSRDGHARTPELQLNVSNLAAHPPLFRLGLSNSGKASRATMRLPVIQRDDWRKGLEDATS